MKDLHWFIVFGLIFITPFLPSLIKAKCSTCGKRSVQSIDTLKVPSDEEESGFTFVTLYRCENCGELFKKVKSGDMVVCSEEEHQSLAAAAAAVS